LGIQKKLNLLGSRLRGNDESDGFQTFLGVLGYRKPSKQVK